MKIEDWGTKGIEYRRLKVRQTSNVKREKQVAGKAKAGAGKARVRGMEKQGVSESHKYEPCLKSTVLRSREYGFH